MRVTTKNLMASFKKLDKSTALKITKLCNGTLDPETLDGGARRVRECYNAPSDTDVILYAINDLLGGYGVESTPYEIGAMHDGEFIEYINFGDSYATTIVWNPSKDRFEINTWADVYEISPAYAEAQGEDY